MNKKMIISISLLSILILIGSISVFAGTNDIYTKLQSKFENLKVEAVKSEDSILDKEKIAKLEKIEDRVKSAWKDIEINSNIAKDKYIALTLSDLSDFSQGKVYNFSEEQIDYILEIISAARRELPKGSMLPIIYVKKDGKEVIVASKKSDGTNIYYESKVTTSKNDKGLSHVTTKREEKGEAIKKID